MFLPLCVLEAHLVYLLKLLSYAYLGCLGNATLMCEMSRLFYLSEFHYTMAYVMTVLPAYAIT